MTPETCPNCGADVPRGARACPACGSDDRTGWSDQAAYDGLGLPDEEFNYDEYVKREFEGKETARPRLYWLWWAGGVAALLAFLIWVLRW